jgi:NADP-dependent 3-hydroxy acid dehydrogenase YdfG
MEDAAKPVWFITGCSTGFGRALAALLLDQNFRVAVTARDVTTLNDLVAGREDRALALTLDVGDKNTVHQAVARAQARFGQIDVLVNNAGYGYRAAVEEGEDDVVRAMFETNFFGLVEVTKAVLPGMRARRQGHIVNISSLAGLVCYAGLGYYNASKFAVEGLSGALAQEMAPLGIKVIVVEPGPFRTDFAGRSIAQSKSEIADYAETAGAYRKYAVAHSTNQPGDPVRGAQAIIDIVTAPEPPRHLLLGASTLELARRELEHRLKDFAAWEKTTRGADYPNDVEHA